MLTAAIAIVLASSTPTPTGTKDVVVGLYYDHQAGQATSLAGSSATSIYLATWRLTDGALCQALSLAASRGVAVQVAYNGSAGTADAQYIATRGIVASGGTVIACTFPQHIANNFMSADANYTLQGNYYYSPTAVQIGSYSMAVSGTHAASVNTTTFATIISGGTITMNDLPSPRSAVACNRRSLHPTMACPCDTSGTRQAARALRADGRLLDCEEHGTQTTLRDVAVMGCLQNMVLCRRHPLRRPSRPDRRRPRPALTTKRPAVLDPGRRRRAR